MGALPDAVEEILGRALVCELTAVDRHRRPVTHPMIPLYDGERILFTSSILFSKKLRHIRENPRVAVSVSDMTATHGAPLAHRVTIQGDAVVRDEDPHEGWLHLLPLWIAKEPIIEAFYAKRVALPLFWERALIEVTPRRAFVWDGGRTDRAPRAYELAGVAR